MNIYITALCYFSLLFEPRSMHYHETSCTIDFMDSARINVHKLDVFLFFYFFFSSFFPPPFLKERENEQNNIDGTLNTNRIFPLFLVMSPRYSTGVL